MRLLGGHQAEIDAVIRPGIRLITGPCGHWPAGRRGSGDSGAKATMFARERGVVGTKRWTALDQCTVTDADPGRLRWDVRSRPDFTLAISSLPNTAAGAMERAPWTGGPSVPRSCPDGPPASGAIGQTPSTCLTQSRDRELYGRVAKVLAGHRWRVKNVRCCAMALLMPPLRVGRRGASTNSGTFAKPIIGSPFARE